MDLREIVRADARRRHAGRPWILALPHVAMCAQLAGAELRSGRGVSFWKTHHYCPPRNQGGNPQDDDRN